MKWSTLCPSCGAGLEFKSSISTMAVCEYCQSTILRNAEEVKDLGKIGALLEDYSPIQIGTTGIFSGKKFSVIGRIQLKYDAGLWNEWYLLLEDGRNAWLGDFSGQYSVTLEMSEKTLPEKFEDFVPDTPFNYAGKNFTVTDIRTASCNSGQGELPFVIGKGWEAKVIDCRHKEHFLTLDYSLEKIRIFLGKGFSKDDLVLSNLRSPEVITESAGRIKGKIQALDCPHCGGVINYITGMTSQLVCPSCQAEIEYLGDKAEVINTTLAVNETLNFSLEIGDIAHFQHKQWTLIGLIKWQELADLTSTWLEYLFYEESQGFMWLIETEAGWFQSMVLNTLPEEQDITDKNYTQYSATLSGIHFELADYSPYTATVKIAAGAFNWRVKKGDTATFYDYISTHSQLNKVVDGHEVNWSRAKNISLQELRLAIPNRFNAITNDPVEDDTEDKSALRTTGIIALIILVVLNAPAIISSFSDEEDSSALIFTLLAGYLMYFPIKRDDDE